MKKLILNLFSKKLYWMLLILCAFSLVPLSAMKIDEEERAGTQQVLPKMKFKLGFEFQEGSGLCPWALNNFHVQKKELFSLNDETNKRKLWHVVIDGTVI